MAEIVKAIYENGVLRPLSPLKLAEQQTVSLQILPEQPIDPVEEAIQQLINNGLLTPPLGYSEVEPVSEVERQELAETLGQSSDKPLSEMIIEERGAL